MTQMKEQIKIPEVGLSNKEIHNLSDAEFKTLVIRMLTEIIEYRLKIEEEVKAIQNEIKKKIDREPTVKGRKLGLKSTVWTRRKKETSNQKRMKKQEFRKMRRGLGTSRTTLNIPTFKSWVPEGEEKG